MIEYEVKRSNIKNIYITIKEGKVLVKVPGNVTEEKIQKVVLQKEKWILKKLKEYENSSRKPKQYENGECFSILGKNYFLQVLENKSEKVELKIVEEDLIIKIPKLKEIGKEQEKKILQNTIEDFYQELAEIVIPEEFQKMAKLVKLFPEEIRIKKLKSVWGKCTSKKIITINRDIVLYSKTAICYVILHEICHLHYMNHSKQFWKMVENYMPEYKMAEKELKEN